MFSRLSIDMIQYTNAMMTKQMFYIKSITITFDPTKPLESFKKFSLLLILHAVIGRNIKDLIQKFYEQKKH